MTEVKIKRDNGVINFELDMFPEEFGNSWCFIHEFGNNHKIYSHMFCLYHNDDFPRGTIIVSPYFYHKYPDIYTLYSNSKEDPEKKILGTRVHVNPKYRGQQWFTWYVYLTRTIFWKNFGLIADIDGDRNKKMESWYQRYSEISGHTEKIKNNGRMNYPPEEMPRDPTYPYIWYNNRICEKIKVKK